MIVEIGAARRRLAISEPSSSRQAVRPVAKFGAEAAGDVVSGGPTPRRDRDAVSDVVSGGPTRRRDRDAVVHCLFRAQYRPLVRLAKLMVQDDDRAEDLVQDAFVHLYRRWWSLRDPDRALFYLRSCVANGARDALRARRAAWRLPPEVAASAPSAEVSAIRHEQEEDVLRGLAGLAARQRQVLVLRYYLDLREAEIAETLRISPGAVKVHATRGIDNLASYLQARQ